MEMRGVLRLLFRKRGSGLFLLSAMLVLYPHYPVSRIPQIVHYLKPSYFYHLSIVLRSHLF